MGSGRSKYLYLYLYLCVSVFVFVFVFVFAFVCVCVFVNSSVYNLGWHDESDGVREGAAGETNVIKPHKSPN